MLLDSSTLVCVAFVPRSGSNYLCDMMFRVGGLTIPMEYYFPYEFQERRIYWDSRTNEFERIDKDTVPHELAWFMEVTRRGGVKCTWNAFECLLEEAGTLLTKYNVKYIYLRRRDKIRQAISWYRANHNKQWTSKEDKEYPDPPYDETEIEQRLYFINLDEKRWGEYLRDKECLPLFYEDLSYDTLKQVEEFIGMKRQRDRDLDSDYTILRDGLTEEWVERYAKSHDTHDT